jgi:hypothetical protein
MVSAQTRLFLIALFLVLCCTPLVSAQYVSFADPDATTHRDIAAYYQNGTYIGLFNTTSSGILIPGDGDLLFVLKPQYSNPIEDPAVFLNSLMSWAQTNALALIILAIVIGLAFRKW